MLDGLAWHREDDAAKHVDGQPTWWATGQDSEHQPYWYYCARQSEWRVSNAQFWDLHASLSPNCSTVGQAVYRSSTLFTSAGDHQVTQGKSTATVTVGASDCSLYELYGFENTLYNAFYHRVPAKQAAGRPTWWEASQKRYIFYCNAGANAGTWMLGEADNWNENGGSQTGCAHAYRSSRAGGKSPAQYSWVADTGATSAGDLQCQPLGWSDTVEVTNAAPDLAGWYARDDAKTFAGKPTFWKGNKEKLIYWCPDNGGEWHLRSAAVWNESLSTQDTTCDGPAVGAFRKPALSGTHFGFPAGGWERYTGTSWEPMDASKAPYDLRTQCRHMQTHVIDGFSNVWLNKRYYEYPGKRVSGRPTYWDVKDHAVLYFCRQHGQWRIAPGTSWSDISKPGENCPVAGFRADGTFASEEQGAGHWWEYDSGYLVGAKHTHKSGECPRFVFNGFRHQGLNDVFQGFTLDWQINGRPTYWTPGTLYVVYYCETTGRWTITQGYDNWEQASQLGHCPAIARKTEATAASRAGGWEESCTPGVAVVVDGTVGTSRYICKGSPAGGMHNYFGSVPTAEACRAACDAEAACKHATWDHASGLCTKWDACDPNSYASHPTPVSIISRCPSSGWTTTRSTTAACEGALEARQTIEGCRCVKHWEYKGVQVKDYCGTPDGASWPWCFVENPNGCGHNMSWGWCKAPGGAGADAGEEATPAPPRLLGAASEELPVREKALRSAIDSLSAKSGTCCSDAIGFVAHSGTTAKVEKVNWDLEVQMQIVATRWPITDTEKNAFEAVIAQQLGLPVSRIYGVMFTQGLLTRRGWHALESPATAIFVISNPAEVSSSGLEEWHVGLIAIVAVAAAACIALCIALSLCRGSADGMYRKADYSHLLFGGAQGVKTEARVVGPMGAGPSQTLSYGASPQEAGASPRTGGTQKSARGCRSGITPRLVTTEGGETKLWDKLSAAARLRQVWKRLVANRSRKLCEMLFSDGERRPTRIDFTDLAVRTQDLNLCCTTKPVLQPCTGFARGGKLTGLLGPSGAGKTTLLNAIAGRIPKTGLVALAGLELHRRELRQTICYVSQDNAGLLSDLTVRENVVFSARMRSKHRSDSEVQRITDVILALLQLKNVQDERVGDSTHRGISSGEMRRTSIAVELVAEPHVLVLDEPTSGLDAQSAAMVCSLLRQLADFSGVTVLASLDAPSAPILGAFDDLILLSPDYGKYAGGRLVYNGPATSATTYFEKVIGIPCNTALAGSDESAFLMQVLDGKVEYQCAEAAGEWQTLNAEELEARWTHFTRDEAFEMERAVIMHPQDLKDEDDAWSAAKGPQVPELPGGLMQLFVFFDRAVVRSIRKWRSRAIDTILVAVCGFYTGLLFVGQKYVSPECSPPCDITGIQDIVAGINEGRSTAHIRQMLEMALDPFPAQAGLVVLAVAICTACIDLRVFTNLRAVFRQESAQGLSAAAFFVANDVANILWITLTPLAFLIPYWLWVHETGIACANFGGYYEVLLPLSFTASALAYFVSSFVPRTNAQLCVVVCILVLMRIYDIQDMPWLRYFSFMRWAQEAFYLEDYHCLAEKAAASHGAFIIGDPPPMTHSSSTPWNKNGFSEAIGWLWAWGFALRAATMGVFLYRKFRGSDWQQ